MNMIPRSPYSCSAHELDGAGSPANGRLDRCILSSFRYQAQKYIIPILTGTCLLALYIYCDGVYFFFWGGGWDCLFGDIMNGLSEILDVARGNSSHGYPAIQSPINGVLQIQELALIMYSCGLTWGEILLEPTS